MHPENPENAPVSCGAPLPAGRAAGTGLTVSRRAPRRALRALALAAVPVLLAAGCSSGSDGEEPADDQPSPSASPTPEPVRFAELPEPCATVSGDTISDVVPEADPEHGDKLDSPDPATSAACLWSGLDDYQFRSLTVSLRRFDSDLSVGSGDERAVGYVREMVEEITSDEDNKDVETAALAGTGDEATSIAYHVKKAAGEDEEEYRQHRVVARTANVVVTVDYSGAGFEGDDTPGAGGMKEAAEAVAEEVVAAVNATAEEPGGAEGGADEGADAGGPGGAQEDAGGAGDAESGEPPSNSVEGEDAQG
ncbi:DUF3558 domain-containing protein [Streptomyces hoynatensis]|uniref:DUF3558 domain-containing protein n=1 Tax=Streptomyces hoynatensis TaxID=1141874 RepID=A0A3A9Z376_9ACTN|nr:DUF3558 domain-containing protein [Streptomyces hoynatensis]RKN41856.1 DUF3558 domain-containing protein [Streptomyces hoynatensis]